MHIYQDAHAGKGKQARPICFDTHLWKQRGIVRQSQKKRVEKETQLMIVALTNIRIKTEDILRLNCIPEFYLRYYLKIFCLIYEV